MDYKLLEVVGRGKFGTVHKAQALGGAIVAVKILNLDTDSEEIKDIQGEVQLLSHLRGAPNIPAYHGSIIKGHKLWVVMDFCAGGSIRTLLKPGPLDEKYIGVIARELFIALQFIHNHNVIHRDIKAANILISKEGHVRLCDFGVAARLTATVLKRTTMAGTPYWMAPEVITEGATYNYKADIWSAGITIYEMATGNPPYSDKDAMRAMQLLTQHEPPRLEGRQYSTLLKDVIALCLEENPRVRPSAEEVLKCKFIRTYKPVPTNTLKEVIGRYLLWRDNNQATRLEEEQSLEVANLDEGEPYDIKWDFNSLKSAEYIMDNDIEINNYIAPTNEIPRSNSTTMMDHTGTTFTIGKTLTGTLGPTQSRYQTQTQTQSNTIETDSTNSQFQTNRKEGPRSLLNLFEISSPTPIPNDVLPTPIEDPELEMEEADSPVLQRPPSQPLISLPASQELNSISIEIPNMDNIASKIVEKERQRSRSSTTTATNSTKTNISDNTNSTANTSTNINPIANVQMEVLPMRRPTISLAKRTPSPSKLNTSLELSDSPIKSAKQMKPIQFSLSQQPLLQPLNQKITPPSSALTMPSVSTLISSDQNQQDPLPLKMPVPSNKRESTIIPSSTLPRPVLHLNLNGGNSPLGLEKEKNQFGVDTNAPLGLPLAMTPVSESIPMTNTITPDSAGAVDHSDHEADNDNDNDNDNDRVLNTDTISESSTSSLPLHMNAPPQMGNIDFSLTERFNEPNDTLTDMTFEEQDANDNDHGGNDDAESNTVVYHQGQGPVEFDSMFNNHSLLSPNELAFDLSENILPTTQDKLINIINDGKSIMNDVLDMDFESQLDDDLDDFYLDGISNILGKISEALELTVDQLAEQNEKLQKMKIRSEVEGNKEEGGEDVGDEYLNESTVNADDADVAIYANSSGKSANGVDVSAHADKEREGDYFLQIPQKNGRDVNNQIDL